MFQISSIWLYQFLRYGQKIEWHENVPPGVQTEIFFFYLFILFFFLGPVSSICVKIKSLVQLLPELYRQLHIFATTLKLKVAPPAATIPQIKSVFLLIDMHRVYCIHGCGSNIFCPIMVTNFWTDAVIAITGW